MYRINLTEYNKIDYYYENNNIIGKILIFLYKKFPLPNFIKVILNRIRISIICNNLLLIIRYISTKTRFYILLNYIKNHIKPKKSYRLIKFNGINLGNDNLEYHRFPEFLDIKILDNCIYNLFIEHPIKREINYKMRVISSYSLREFIDNIKGVYHNIYQQEKETKTDFTLECIRKCTSCKKHINIKSYNDYTIKNSVCGICSRNIDDIFCVKILKNSFHRECLEKAYRRKLFILDKAETKCKLCNKTYSFEKLKFNIVNPRYSVGFNRSMQSNGRYGIWGYALNDLVLKEIIIENKKNNTELYEPNIYLIFN